jgi:XTP/dITP diphosphohydrolase
VLDGIALSQPALSLAAQMLHRVERAGLPVPVPADLDLGSSLLRVVAEARESGLDAEAALRSTVLAYAEAVRRAETVTPDE